MSPEKRSNALQKFTVKVPRIFFFPDGEGSVLNLEEAQQHISYVECHVKLCRLLLSAHRHIGLRGQKIFPKLYFLFVNKFICILFVDSVRNQKESMPW